MTTDAIISVVVGQLASFVQQEVKLVLSVRKDVNALTSTLQMLQAVLCNAETRQIKEEAVRLWLDKLKAIVYDVEDVLDEWNTRNPKPLIQGVDDVHLHKTVFFCCLSPCLSTRSVVVRYDIGSRIKDIKERLDNVANEKDKFRLNESQIHEEPRERLTCSFIDVPHTYGREQAKIDLANLLLGESSAQAMNTNVISIVGTGGFGKTTLANLVLEEVKVKEIFDKTAFVCVSEPFKLLEVARSIIEQITGMTPSVNEREPVLQCLLDNLKGKRFLLVLDDVWTEDINDWTPLKHAFDRGAQGSWVIVTTRNEKVAEMMHSNHTHNLAKLADPDSWLLFEHVAFAGRQELSKFEEIGKKIAAKCKGVPLAIKIVGGLVRSMKTKNEWNHVLTSEIWEIEEIEKGISPSFFLSYNHLPSKLKQCFMYCAIFPKDTRLYKDELVKLWMAQGFLGYGGHKNLEKIGCDYFDDLAMHSFFQDFEKGPEGNITSSKMHDLVHDFAQFLTKGECSLLEDSKELDGTNNVRHLVTESLESSSIFMAKNLRTLLITESVSPDQLIGVFNQLKRIRILDLSGGEIEELPRQIKELLHLRYLDLSSTELLELSETICQLYNLQTLKLNGCTQLIKLPGGIGNLLNLRHLELEGTGRLSCLPQGIGRLRFLRSLCKFIVGDAGNGCSIKELKDLSYLQGSLEIIGLERVADASEAAQVELKNKSILILSLKFERLEQGESEKMTSVLENLQPHEDVELNIYGFGGSRFPSWISANISMLANLLKLKLSNCDYTTKLPALGNLASLEELTLKGMKSVKHIGREFYGPGVAFPKLQKLQIEEMNELVEWELPIARDNKMIIMPCLSRLWLWNCPMLRALPGLGTLESLESLSISELPMIKQVGYEFLGISAADGCSMDVAFPKLKTFKIEKMNELEEWELPIARDNQKIMPCLSKLELSNCPLLRALPGLGTLESLENLELSKLPSIKQVGFEFLGISATDGCSMDVAFPKLKTFKIEEMNELVEWELPIARDNKKIMPCLSKLSNCLMLRALPGLGTLESLEDLHMYNLSMIKEVGFEFLGISAADGCSMDVAFPKLKVLEIEEMNELVEWELPIARDNKKIMPCLSELTLLNCPMLRALPAGFGTLESLESLWMCGLSLIKEVGYEFLGISAGDEFGGGEGEGEKGIVPNNLRNISSAERKGSDKPGEGGSSSSSSYVRKPVILFPQLTYLQFYGMEELEVWILPPFQEDIQIMPRLTRLDVSWCPKLRALPDLTRFKSLEILSIAVLEGLVELIEREEGISFPGSLRELTLERCNSLRVIPGYLFPHTLKQLSIAECSQLRGVQPCLPPLLQYLLLKHDVCWVYVETLSWKKSRNQFS